MRLFPSISVKCYIFFNCINSKPTRVEKHECSFQYTLEHQSSIYMCCWRSYKEFHAAVNALFPLEIKQLATKTLRYLETYLSFTG